MANDNVLSNMKIEQTMGAQTKVTILTKFEKLILFSIITLLVVLMSLVIFTRNKISETNAILQNTQRHIETTNLDNQLLEQKIDDLSTYTRVSTIAQQYGLERREDNVRNVAK